MCVLVFNLDLAWCAVAEGLVDAGGVPPVTHSNVAISEALADSQTLLEWIHWRSSPIHCMFVFSVSKVGYQWTTQLRY